jgi:hypothetical protein
MRVPELRHSVKWRALVVLMADCSRTRSLYVNLYGNIISCWIEWNREGMRHPSCIVAASVTEIRAFVFLHLQGHTAVRSMLNRPRELDSVTLKTEATSYETSEPSSYTV